MTGDGQEAPSHRGVEGVLDMLRSEGNRVTTSRRLLIGCLVEAKGHLTAEEIAEDLARRAPDIHLSTIYRNLDELERIGVVSHSHLGHGPATYHLSTKVHGHLVCEDCGITIEAPDEIFAELAAVVLGEHGFIIDPHHFAVLGRCAACHRRFVEQERVGESDRSTRTEEI
ncbi:MAG TPA: transcriptional repressor [Acidimicrobiales bacterium]|nr:transcriptional repressor [Acidimicrobiales bacterium]